tara:strand:+ start:4206 stop:4634 length:429 start_codon:yes stop_codon:yes gene_type:complete
MRNYIIDSVVLLIVLAGMVGGAFLPGELTFFFCTVVAWSLLGLRIGFRLQNKFVFSTCLQYTMMFGLLGAFIAQAVYPIISGGNWLDGYPFFILILAVFLGSGLGLFLKKIYPPETFEKIALAAGIFATVMAFIVVFSRRFH